MSTPRRPSTTYRNGDTERRTEYFPDSQRVTESRNGVIQRSWVEYVDEHGHVTHTGEIVHHAKAK